MYKYNRIANSLLEEIKLMKPDTRLMSRAELCEKYNTTRTTIDKAIADLVHKGTLYTIKGSGTYVSQRNFYGSSQNNGILTWGVVMPDVMSALYPAILRGVSDIASKQNVNVSIYNTDNDAKKEYDCIKMLVNSNVNGVIIIPAITDDFIPETYELMKRNNIPFVFCNRNIEKYRDIPFVCSNGFYGGYIATKHLIQKGYKSIGFFSYLQYSIMLQRYQGYVAAMIEAGLAINTKHIIMRITDIDVKSGIKFAIKELFSHENRPDSLFVAGEDLIVDLYQNIKNLGLKISDDVGIISHDNSSLCEQVYPQATAVSFQSYQAGYNAATFLMKMLNNELNLSDLNMHILQPSLEIRESCLGIK